MLRSFLLSLALLFTATTLVAQSLNTTLRSQVQFNSSANDVWGYVAPDGTEYALVGKQTGVSIVSLADPGNAIEVTSIPGQFSLWRDLKTYGDYAYVVADQGGTTEGITIIDLTNLPGPVTYTQGPRVVPGAGTFNKAHNIFIDEGTGIAYIAGANVNGGGMLLYDIATTPGEATFLALAPRVYAHDVFVQNGRMYASEISTGDLSIYDASNPQNITLLSTTETPFAYTHNAWTTTDQNYVFTTDERGNAPVATYDISDEASPVLLDEFRPVRSIGTGTIPHNVHVIDEYLSISYYTDGLEVVDASVPNNVVEVAYYDTWQGSNGGTDNGSWGAYPFLPSGLTLVTDRISGLYVVDVDYIRAARLKGTITDELDGSVLNGVSVTLNSNQALPKQTDATGKYATGLATAGTYDVTFSKVGYNDLTVSVDLENDLEVVLDTSMATNTPRYAVISNVISSADASPIAGTEVVISGESGTFTTMTDENGMADLGFLFAGEYQIYAAKWGFRNIETSFTLAEGTETTIELDPGYLNGFVLDQGWTASDDGQASGGLWERDVPYGTFYQGEASAPDADSDTPTDIGDFAYVTGNQISNSAGSDDVDSGVVTLTSPAFDATIFGNPVVSYQYWFFNGGGNPPTNDYLRVEISDGSQTVTLAEYTESTSAWVNDTFVIAEFITPTNEMHIIVTTEDQNSTGHLVEGGFDDFELRGSLVSATENVALAGLEASIFPNPSNANFVVNYALPSTPQTSVVLTVTDQLGRTVTNRSISLDVTGNLTFGKQLPAGLYYARLIVDDQVAYTTKLVKE